jgi:hypothetical protein
MIKAKHFYIDHENVIHVVTGNYPAEIHGWYEYYSSDSFYGRVDYGKYKAALNERRKKLQVLKDTAIRIEDNDILLAEECLWYLKEKYVPPTHENFKKFFSPNEFYESNFEYYYKVNEDVIDALDNGIRHGERTASISLVDEESVAAQMIADPQPEPENEFEIWKSIFEDGWYTTDNLEIKIARLYQNFEIKRRHRDYKKT